MAPFLASNAGGDVLSEQLENTSLEPTLAMADELRPAEKTEQKEEEWVYPYPTDFKLSEHPIDEPREIEVWLKS